MKRRKIAIPVALASAIATAGCGFHPLFAHSGANGGGQQTFNSIYVDPVDGGRAGYELRNSLIDLIQGSSWPNQALYRLKVAMKQSIEGTAVQTNGYITRYSYTMTADYQLSSRPAGCAEVRRARNRGPYPDRSRGLFRQDGGTLT
jgi:hypothetical protein